MSIRSILFAVVIAVVAGIIGYVLGTRERHEKPTERTVAERPPAETPVPERVAAPPAPPSAADEPAPSAADPRRPDAPGDHARRMQAGAAEYIEALQIPEQVTEEARALDVPDHVVRLVYAAEWWLHAERQYAGPVQKEGVRASLASLAAQGEHAFRAVVALVRGNGFGQHYPRIVAATWRPGLEQHLCEAGDALLPRGQMVRGVYEALGGIDTDGSRRYLRGALERHRHEATRFVAAAMALGRLGDAESAPAVVAALGKRSWSGLHPALVDALGGMGGDTARDALVAYLHRPNRSLPSRAVRALARIDPVRARAEAETLLAGDTLTPTERHRIEAFVAGSN